MSLRSILGGSGRVKKKSPSTLSSRPSAAKRSSSSSASPSPSWTSSLPRRKPGATSSSKRVGGDDDDDWFDDKLDDLGLVAALATDLNLRDTPQAIQYIRARMFAPIPETAAGMTSTRISEVLNYRRNLPPIISIAHVQALLASPSAVEREVAELARRGFLRRIVVPRRGAVGEFIVLSSDYEASIKRTTRLGENTRETLLQYLASNPDVQVLGRDALKPAEIAELVHAGFLTAHHSGGVVSHDAISGTMRSYARPEDKITLTSLETISRQAAGSLGTVGGQGALRNAGGSGGGSLSVVTPTTSPGTEYRLAAPGAGSFLKLVSAALDHLVSLLGKSRFREVPESVLRERWDGGIARVEDARHAAAAAAKKARGEFAGVLPGQTRKWRQFYGLAFDWVLQEAVGAGLVEVFETGSVGRGVRAIR
ncbi:serine-threonine protein kinase 19-domain-containing protein [Xylaria bambusicola]|uniref:serine-threonine protein kinase 19-domain-containing protein n=1 Tax=Xylaria bambusicola TaxID=326684 RepID=UPI002008BB06|nr:serine-threonine protein kinase 19-domain-containing protein [Xylaria bambusicola]KAI0523850.1 serine-threonine protein kinase 19-domain-containing protein [Xylaria bambusicola]